MQIDVKAKTEQGDVVFEGTLNKREVGFLLQYAINDLLVAGVQFNLDAPEQNEDEADALRMKFPHHGEFND